MPKIDPTKNIQVRSLSRQSVVGLVSRHPTLQKSYLVFWSDKRMDHFAASSIEEAIPVKEAHRLPNHLRKGAFVILSSSDDPHQVYWIEELDSYAATLRRIIPGRGFSDETFRFKNKLLRTLQGHNTDIHEYNKQRAERKGLAAEVEKLRETMTQKGLGDLAAKLDPSNHEQATGEADTEKGETARTTAGDDGMDSKTEQNASPRFDSTKELMQYGVKLGMGKATQEQAIKALQARFPDMAHLFENPMFLAGLKMVVPLMGLQLAGHIKSEGIAAKVTDASQAMLLVNTIDGTAQVTGAVASQLVELGGFLFSLYGISGDEAAEGTRQLMEGFGVDADEILKTSKEKARA